MEDGALMTKELVAELQNIYDRCYGNQEHMGACDAGTLVTAINLLERPSVADEITQLRGNLSLAEEGLASAMQEIQRVYGLMNHWSGAAQEKDAEIEQLTLENQRLQALFDGAFT
jgi:hypothetical protein